ncbi:hypothetical protein ACQKWADRAFT_280138 [Trichoderma austrokoningii]
MRLINTKTFELEEIADANPPPYAILSHTWGRDVQELSFSDVQNGINTITSDQKKPGLTKFRRCCEQAQADSLGYAWIDTCCIDKTNMVELGEAINSMFRWYSLATVCYAYLSDVPDDDDPPVPASRFRTSRWFTRGWTLQELLAPKYLRFYNAEWRLIGTKGNRCTVLQEITRVPRQFLLGVAELYAASVAQRMSWAAQRETKRAEDLAYCLLGIFGITMPMIYGEGGREAFFRLQEQIMKTTRDDSILAWGLDHGSSASNAPKFMDGDKFIYGDILAATPSDFADSGHIIAREQATNPLHSLDIFGGSLRIYLPLLTIDTGETFGLLSCGPKSDSQQVAAIPLAKIMSAAANEYVRPREASVFLHPKPEDGVLPELIHIKKDGQKNKSVKNQQYLHYDEDTFAKLGLVIVEVVPRAWWDDQLALMSPIGTGQMLIRARQSNNKESLDFVIIIDFHQPDTCTDQLCCVFTCDRKTALEDMAEKFQRRALEMLQQTNASNKFLHLRVEIEHTEENMISIIPIALASPPVFTINATMALENLDVVLELTRLFWERKRNDVDIEELCQRAEDDKSRLAHMGEERRAIESEIKRLEEKKSILAEEEQIKVEEMRRLDESQETIRKRRNEIFQQMVNLQKRLMEFYRTKKSEDGWIPFRSVIEIDDMDIRDLPFDISTDILTEDKWRTRWITASIKGDADEIRSLLATEEAELEHKDGIFGRTPLSWASMHGHLDVVKQLLDTRRVDVRSEDNQGRTPVRWALDGGYCEIVRLLLQRDKPAHLRELRGHNGNILSVAFSHDSKFILSGSADRTVRLWDNTTSECLHTFLGHTGDVIAVAFLHDSKLVLSGSVDRTIKLWDVASRKSLYTIDGHEGEILSVAFSQDSKILASSSLDDSIKLRDSATGKCLHTLRGHGGRVLSIAFSHDAKLLASGSFDGTIQLWDTATGECLHTLRGHSGRVLSIAFSPDSNILASGSSDNTIKLWDGTTGQCLQTSHIHHSIMAQIVFSPDAKLLASTSANRQTIQLRDSATGVCLQELLHPPSSYRRKISIAFSHDSKLIAIGVAHNVLLWDISMVHEFVTSSCYQESFATGAEESNPIELEEE